MNKFIALLLLLTTSVSAGPVQQKVSHINGTIDEKAARTYFEETNATLASPGPRTVYINSLGGYLYFGQVIIDMMEVERSHGVQIVCVVTDEATSMAFNILTHCDKRYAVKGARFLVHKAAIGSWPEYLRPTAKNLRTMANELAREDEPYRIANAKAMHLSLADYDDNADQERTWSARELIALGYLDGYYRR